MDTYSSQSQIDEFHALRTRLAAAEQALAVEQSRRIFLERLVSTLNDAVIVVDSEQRVQEWSEGAERVYGWRADEVRGQNLQALLDTRFLSNTSLAAARSELSNQGHWRELVTQRHRDGHELFIESAVRPLRDATGAVVGLVGVNRDVTARTQAEAALRQSEAVLRAFLDNTAESHYLLDAHYRVIAFNRVAFEEMQRIWRREIRVGDDMHEYIAPSTLDEFAYYFERCLRGESFRFEREVRLAPNQVEWFELAYMPIRKNNGDVTGVAFSAYNTSARRNAESKLAQREAQLAGIIDSAMDAIITIDSNHRIVLFNGTAEQVFGISAAEVLGETLDRFMPAEANRIHDQHIITFATTGVTRRSMAHPSVVDAIRADGSRFPIEATISQIEVAGQHFFTVILRDLSERRQLEAQLMQAQKLESIGRLAGGIAHDFNNLLTTISGAAELAQTSLPIEHAAQADLADILQTVQRSAALTRRLLAFARQQVLAPRELDLNQLLRDLEPLLHRLLGTSIELHFLLAPHLAPIVADTPQLEQVVMNLVVNARDAMPKGGQLVIRTETAIFDQLGELASQLPNEYVRLIVEDSGQGIPAAVLPYIFEPFFTTKPPGKGTGLGLSTTYGIVRQHGGQIAVQSIPGGGTSFTIDLPARHEDTRS